MDLQTLWFAAVAVLWTGFLLLEGFDFGVAALMPVLGRDDADRHLMLRSIGPLWDGNEVWLITAAGAVFAAFPGWYATWLPALYLPFVLVLFGLIMRAVAFEWRHSSHDPPGTRAGPGDHRRLAGRRARGGRRTRRDHLGLPIDADGNRVGGSLRRARLAGGARRGRGRSAFAARARGDVPRAEDRRRRAPARAGRSPSAGRRWPRCPCCVGRAGAPALRDAGDRRCCGWSPRWRSSSRGRGSGSAGRARRSPRGG